MSSKLSMKVVRSGDGREGDVGDDETGDGGLDTKTGKRRRG